MLEKLQKIEDIDRYLPRDITDETKVKPKYWELQNRKSFYQWLDDHFKKYNQGDKESREKVNFEEIQPNKDRIISQLSPVQKLIRDFMQGASPYRGILAYYGLGVGKTQTAISIANAIDNKDDVIFMSKAALEPNFISGVKKGGVDYMVNNNYWVFLSKSDNSSFLTLVKKIGVPKKTVDKLGGIYIIDYSMNKSNYNELSNDERDELNEQINALINKKFKFMHYDDTRLIRKLEDQEYKFDNKVVIIDEVHNLINGMTKPKSGSAKLYKMFMDAENAKFIFLTGTPIINKVYEAAKLFNILRGKIYYTQFKIKHMFSSDINYRKIKQEILKNRNIDQVIINKINKTVKITFNPDGYLTSIEPDKKGIIYMPKSPLLKSKDDVSKDIEKSLSNLGYKFDISKGYETALPDDEDDFNMYFYNPDLNKIKKKELFKKRIANLTSFYDYKDPELFPSIKKEEVIQVPMSHYQLQKYQIIRNEEILKDKKNKNKKVDEENLNSSYRLESRLSCSIVEPEDIPSMFDFRDKKKDHVREEMIEKLKDIYTEDIDELDSKVIDLYFKKYVLNKLEKNKETYFSEEGMKQICPKYYEIIKRLNSNSGCTLIYSYFITFKGLKTLSIAMEATGQWEQLKLKKVDGEWMLDDSMFSPAGHKSSNKQENMKNRYIFYSGQQSNEEKEILPKIFNSQFDLLPNNCDKLKEQLEKLYGLDNRRGQVVKALMTTKTGAEGLDLKNIRHVHICEPYWQPVLIEQVIGRAVRTNSHIALPIDERNVSIYIYMATIPKVMYGDINLINVRQDTSQYNDGLNMKGLVATSDEALYITSARKKAITNELLNMIKDTAFDCNLNYAKNKKQHGNIVCMDYETADRDEYLFTPHLDDTMDIISIKQDYYVTTKYTKFKFKGVIYYFNSDPTSDGKYYIYDESVVEKTRAAKPLGRLILKNGKFIPAFFKKSNNTKKNIKKDNKKDNKKTKKKTS